jgi:mannosyltransferase OCH1-like enzyme
MVVGAPPTNNNGGGQQHHSQSAAQQHQQHKPPSIVFIALGFLLVANVSCFLLFAALLDEEEDPKPSSPLHIQHPPAQRPAHVGTDRGPPVSESSAVVRGSPAHHDQRGTAHDPPTTYLRRAAVTGGGVGGEESSNYNNVSSIIPRVLIFTHAMDLLHEDLNFLQDDTNYDELVALQENVQSIIELHTTTDNDIDNASTDSKTTTVRFLTNDECRDGILATTAVNATVANELVGYFETEPTGMYKADLCRGIALYETGGLYFDVDLGVRLDIFATLQKSTEFATIRVHPRSHHPGNFFQAFIASVPCHPVLKRYIELFVEYYRGHLEHELQRRPLGVVLLRMAYDQVEREELQRQSSTASSSTADLTTTNTTANRTHLNQTSEIWQEFHYNWDYEHTLLAHVPAPNWGVRRACKFIVLSAPTLPLVVPFYSRIAGSRMCPKTTTKHNNNNKASATTKRSRRSNPENGTAKVS